MSHALHDAVGVELARRIARDLPANPHWIDIARANLDRWSNQNSTAPSLLRCYDEWRGILSRPMEEIRVILTAETDEGQRIRQNSPFVGVLPPHDVWEIKRRAHAETPA